MAARSWAGGLLPLPQPLVSVAAGCCCCCCCCSIGAETAASALVQVRRQLPQLPLLLLAYELACSHSREALSAYALVSMPPCGLHARV